MGRSPAVVRRCAQQGVGALTSLAVPRAAPRSETTGGKAPPCEQQLAKKVASKSASATGGVKKARPARR
jgi:hypothetical protein